MQSKHDESISFKCETCDRTFNLKSNLKKHIKQMHTYPKPKSMSRPEQLIYNISTNLKNLLNKKRNLTDY